MDFWRDIVQYLETEDVMALYETGTRAMRLTLKTVLTEFNYKLVPFQSFPSYVYEWKNLSSLSLVMEQYSDDHPLAYAEPDYFPLEAATGLQKLELDFFGCTAPFSRPSASRTFSSVFPNLISLSIGDHSRSQLFELLKGLPDALQNFELVLRPSKFESFSLVPISILSMLPRSLISVSLKYLSIDVSEIECQSISFPPNLTRLSLSSVSNSSLINYLPATVRHITMSTNSWLSVGLPKRSVKLSSLPRNLVTMVLSSPDFEIVFDEGAPPNLQEIRGYTRSVGAHDASKLPSTLTTFAGLWTPLEVAVPLNELFPNLTSLDSALSDGTYDHLPQKSLTRLNLKENIRIPWKLIPRTVTHLEISLDNWNLQSQSPEDFPALRTLKTNAMPGDVLPFKEHHWKTCFSSLRELEIALDFFETPECLSYLQNLEALELCDISGHSFASKPEYALQLPISLTSISFMSTHGTYSTTWMGNLGHLHKLTSLVSLRDSFKPLEVSKDNLRDICEHFKALPPRIKRMSLSHVHKSPVTLFSHLPASLKHFEYRKWPKDPDFSAEHFRGLPRTLRYLKVSGSLGLSTPEIIALLPPFISRLWIDHDPKLSTQFTAARDKYYQQDHWNGLGNIPFAQDLNFR